MGHFGDVSPSQSIGLVWEITKPNTTNAHIHQWKENKHKKIQPGLVAFYDIRPGNAVGLLSKEKTSKEGDK